MRAGWLPAALAGAAAGFVAVGLWAMLYGVGLTPFPPFDLGDILIRAAPGDAATWAIETFGRSAQRLILVAGVVIWIVLFALLGLLHRSGLASRIGQLTGAALALPAVLIAYWSEGGFGVARGIWLAIALALPLMLVGHLLAGWLNRLVVLEREAAIPTTGSWLDRPGSYGRRELLQRVGVTVAIIGLGGSAAGWLLRRAGTGTVDTAAGTDLDTLDLEIDGTPVDPSFADPVLSLPTEFAVPPEVRPRLTPNEEFYVVDISTRDPNLPHEDWSLHVTGLVEREVTLSYADLLTMPSVEQYGTLMCISFVYGSELISTTLWTGVMLRDVLQLAGIQDGAVDLVCRGAGGYSDSIPLAKALEPTTLLTYAMNGVALPRSHGFPCRLYVPNIYGEKNVKWLQEIEVVDYDYLGYWQERGWTDEAIVNVVSFFDTPLGDEVIPGPDDVVPCAGVAFAGSRGIERVEIRIDGGEWQPAEVEPYDPTLVWQRWRYDWRPTASGPHLLTVRAIDRAGNVQIEVDDEPHPNGMTGYQTVQVDVLEG